MAVHVKMHNDLDAIAARIVLEVIGLPIESTTYHDYNTIDDAVINFIKNKQYKSNDTLMLVDICPTQGTFSFLEQELPKELNLVILDHHKTRSWASKYPWVYIDITKCATELVYEKYFARPDPQDPDGKYANLVKSVAAWDLWQLDSTYRTRGENLNTLLGFIGRAEFLQRFVHNPETDLISPYTEILKYLNARKERYVRQVIKEQLTTAKPRMDGLGNTFKTIFATDFLSEIGHALLAHADSEDLRYVCLVNPVSNACSLRSRNGETDVGDIAKMLNGGGHAAAAGFPINFTTEVERTIFKLLNSLES